MSRNLCLLSILLMFPCIFSSSLVFGEDEVLDPGPIEFRESLHSYNEKIDPFTGRLTLSHLELDFPANGELPLNIYRIFNSDYYHPSGLKSYEYPESLIGNGWDIHMGRIFLYGELAKIELNNGYQTHSPNPKAASPIQLRYATTPEGWRLSLPEPTKGTLTLTDGTTITYQLKQVAYNTYWGYASEIRKNNTVIRIQYKAIGTLTNAIDYITYTTGSTERRIFFKYNYLNRISDIFWDQSYDPEKYHIKYEYSTDSYRALTAAIHPGNESWRYTYTDKILGKRAHHLLDRVTNPYGGTTIYTFGQFQKSRASQSGIICGRSVQNSISEKRFIDRNRSAEKLWKYNYYSITGYSETYSTTIGDYTTISEPCGQTIKYKFTGYASHGIEWLEDFQVYGMPEYKEVYLNNIKTITETTHWRNLRDYCYRHSQSDSETASCEGYIESPVLYKKQVSRNGKTYTTIYDNHDFYGRPEKITETGSNTKVTTKTYWNGTDYGKKIYDNKPLTVTTTGDSTFPGTYTTVNTYHTTNDNRYGQVKSITRFGKTTNYDYDIYGNLNSITDANGNTTTYEWTNGAVSRITNPIYSISRIINPDGTVHSETNGRGNTTTYQYDKNGRVVAIEPPIGNSTLVSYNKDADGYLVEKREQLGSVAKWTDFDGVGRVIGTEDSLGFTTITNYDNSGHLASTESNTGDKTEFDEFGRMTKVSHKTGASIDYLYPDDTTVTIKDEKGYTTTQKYNHFGDPEDKYLTTVLNAYNQPTSYKYNILGKLTQTSQDDVVRSFGYVPGTADFRWETHPEDGLTTHVRDKMSNLTLKTQAGKTGIDYHYDQLNRLIEVNTVNNPSCKRLFSYANNEKLHTVTSHTNDPDNFAVRINYDHDENERIVSVTSEILDNIGTSGYIYDENGNVTEITYPSGTTVNYTYNDLNQVTSLQINGITYLSDITYYSSASSPDVGLLQSYKRINGDVASFDYSSTRKLDHAYYPSYTLDYNYDEQENVVRLLGPWVTQTFSYDPLNRIVGFDGGWGVGTYEYAGQNSDDRIRKTLGNAITEYQYSNGKLVRRLVNGNISKYYGYDKGDVVCIGNIHFQYDPYHNLIQSKRDGTVIGEYLYNGLNKRVYKYADGKSTYYYHGKDNETLSEMDENGISLADYIYLNGKMVAKVVPNKIN